MEIAGAAVEKTTITPRDVLRSYADSGETVHCFHSESAFVTESLQDCDTRTVLLTDKTYVQCDNFRNVIWRFENANIRLKRALNIPNIGSNIVSTGIIVDKGIDNTFRYQDIQIFLEPNGFVVGCGQSDPETDIYMLPERLLHYGAEKTMIMSEIETVEL